MTIPIKSMTIAIESMAIPIKSLYDNKHYNVYMTIPIKKVLMTIPVLTFS